jgi:hypothetical protein
MAKKKTSGPAYKSPEFMRELGRRRWKNVPPEERSEHFSRIAKLSHPVNNPEAKRDTYKRKTADGSLPDA